MKGGRINPTLQGTYLFLYPSRRYKGENPEFSVDYATLYFLDANPPYDYSEIKELFRFLKHPAVSAWSGNAGYHTVELWVDMESLSPVYSGRLAEVVLMLFRQLDHRKAVLIPRY